MSAQIDGTLVFIGTQGSGEGQGIYAARLNEEDGTLSAAALAAEAERPTWVTADPRRPVVYAVSEVGNKGDRIGDVASFAIDAASAALQLCRSVPSGGGGPTHLALAPDGGALFVANFGGGQASVLPVDADGRLLPPSSVRTGTGSGPHRRQQGPHAHGVTLDPSGGYLLVPDMGADRVFIYPYDAAARALGTRPELHVAVPAGAGPRLVLFGKDGRFAYLLTELSAEIFVFSWDAQTGQLSPVSSLALDPPEFEDARSAAGFAMSADGRFLYASNRATAVIQAYAIGSDGSLALVQTIDAGGEKPWAIEIAPGGRWALVANQGSDVVRLFARDPASGQLSQTSASLAVPTPTSFTFVPTVLPDC